MNTNNTDLIQAAMNGNCEMLRRLLAEGAHPDSCDDAGYPALWLATVHRHHEVTRLLLESGANPDLEDDDGLGYTPLHNAIANEDIQIVRLLLKFGACINNKGSLINHPPFLYAISWGNMDIIRLLLDSGADINMAGRLGWSPLHVAAEQDTVDVMQLLLQRGANPNAHTDEDETPLHYATSTSAIELLIQAGADVNARAASGWTPLHVAIIDRQEDCVQLLLKAGADLNARLGDGTKTAGWGNACTWNREDCVPCVYSSLNSANGCWPANPPKGALPCIWLPPSACRSASPCSFNTAATFPQRTPPASRPGRLPKNTATTTPA